MTRDDTVEISRAHLKDLRDLGALHVDAPHGVRLPDDEIEIVEAAVSMADNALRVDDENE